MFRVVYLFVLFASTFFTSTFFANTLFCEDTRYAHDFELPSFFQVKQDKIKRFFRIFYGRECLGKVVSSDYGVLDFYDQNNEKLWVNYLDTLFDVKKNHIAFMKLASDLIAQEAREKWFWQKREITLPKSRITLYSSPARYANGDRMRPGKEKILVSFEQEGEGSDNFFVFREAESGLAIAQAVWRKWIPTRYHLLPRNDPSDPVQEWDVTITNQALMQQKQITKVMLIWTLLKHSQKYLPGPYADTPYMDVPPA